MRIAKLAILPLCILLFTSFSKVGEYKVKLAFVKRFTKYIEWPQTAHYRNKNEFRIGIVGSNPFGQALDNLVQNESLKNTNVTYKVFGKLDVIKDCDIVFIPSNHSKKLTKILKEANACGALTIGEKKTYAEQGVMINLLLEYGKIKFEVNKNVLESKGYKANSRVYKIAKIVN